MDKTAWQALFGLTLRAPKEAAAQLLKLPIGQNTLWLTLILFSILNAMVFSISILMSPPLVLPDFLQRIYYSPILFAVILAGGLVAIIATLFWGGRILGGQGAFRDILAALAWLQLLRLVFQIVVTIVIFILPGMADTVVIAGNLIGVWILVGFVDVAHKFDNMGRAFGVIVIAVFSAIFGFSFILSLLGSFLDLGLT